MALTCYFHERQGLSVSVNGAQPHWLWEAHQFTRTCSLRRPGLKDASHPPRPMHLTRWIDLMSHHPGGRRFGIMDELSRSFEISSPCHSAHHYSGRILACIERWIRAVFWRTYFSPHLKMAGSCDSSLQQLCAWFPLCRLQEVCLGCFVRPTFPVPMTRFQVCKYDTGGLLDDFQALRQKRSIACSIWM
jgi:hypothetical protein